MRVLFTSTPGTSHLWLMVPTAWALCAAGHDVAVASRPNLAAAITSAGLTALSIGPELDPIAGMRATLPPGTTQTQMWDTLAKSVGKFAVSASTVRRLVVMATARHYAELGRSVADELIGVARSWCPDLLIHELSDYAGPLAAAALGIPAVRHRWAADCFAGAFDDEARRVLRTVPGRPSGVPAGLPPPAMIIDPGPPDLHLPDAPPGTPMRFIPFNGAAAAPAWTLRPPQRTRVCVSLGTVALALGSAPALRAVLSALDGLDVETIVAINGRDRDLVDPVLPGMRVAEMVPLHLFLPSCALLVHQGGAGSTLTASALGIPQLVLPQHVDQFDNAARIAAAGAGHAVSAPEAQYDSSALRPLLSDLLESPAIAKAARRLAESNQALATPADLVPALTALAA